MEQYTKKGELKVTTADLSKVEASDLNQEDLLLRILLELRRMNVHLSVLSGEDVSLKDIGVEDED